MFGGENSEGNNYSMYPSTRMPASSPKGHPCREKEHKIDLGYLVNI